MWLFLIACFAEGPRVTSPPPPSPTTTTEAPATVSTPVIEPVSGELTAPVTAPVPATAPAELTTTTPTATTPATEPAEDLCASVATRIEGPTTSGECTTDADCTTTGCSAEVCLPAAKAGDVMTTCEIHPCFATLDTCGCHTGVCSWTRKEAVLRKLPAVNP